MNLISYHDQVYLVYYYLRTNYKAYQKELPTLAMIKADIYSEFEISDEDVAQEIYELFHQD